MPTHSHPHAASRARRPETHRAAVSPRQASNYGGPRFVRFASTSRWPGVCLPAQPSPTRRSPTNDANTAHLILSRSQWRGRSNPPRVAYSTTTTKNEPTSQDPPPVPGTASRRKFTIPLAGPPPMAESRRRQMVRSTTLVPVIVWSERRRLHLLGDHRDHSPCCQGEPCWALAPHHIAGSSEPLPRETDQEPACTGLDYHSASPVSESGRSNTFSTPQHQACLEHATILC